MKQTKILAVLIFFAISIIGFAQKKEITARELSEYVTFLASDSLKGRKPGTPEIEVAAKYIRDHFRNSGLKLMEDNGFQWFEIVTDVTLGSGNSLTAKGISGTLNSDFIPLAFSGNGTVSEEVIFAGYGFDIELDGLRWNDFTSIQPKGKWVMVLRGDPEPDVSDSKFIPYSDLRSKVLTLKDKGAAGVLFVSPVSMEKDDKLMPLAPENNDMTAGIPVFHITRNFANQLLSNRSVTIDSLERQIIKTRYPAGFATGVVLSGNADVIQQRHRTANIVAMLPGSDPKHAGEYLVVGAHYDHLGMGGSGSGSRMPDTVAVHNGADDNASGTAMVMALARYFAQNRKECPRSIIFVAFSAEEMGLIGSKYFVNHSPVAPGTIKTMFNFDMVGRFDKEKNSISVSGTGTSVESDSLLTLVEKSFPFQVIHSPDGYGPSDHAAFYSSNIPVFYFNTGVHTDYHTPFDDTDKLDFENQKLVGDFSARVIEMVAGMEKPLTFKESGKKESTGRGGRRLKVTLGIMPDFAGTEKAGLRIDGVTKDGPADKGGMKKGDIITAMNGMKVANIYEYMSRLQKLKHGMTVNVEVLRDGKTEVLIIQL